MKSFSKKAFAVFLSSTLLVACGQGEGNSANSANEMTMNNEMAMNGMAMDPSNPFAQSEMDMDRKMMAAIGTSVADTWTVKMIEHHQGAVDMSRIALANNPTPGVRAIAQETVVRQSKEIEELRGLRQQGAADPALAKPYEAAMMAMHSGMMSAKGADISETYLRKMLEHHTGAVSMSDVALANGVSGPLRAVIEKTRTDQRREIAAIEAMLRGETPAPAAAAPKAASASAEPAAKPPVAEKAAPTRSAPAKAETAAAKPSAPTSNTTATCAPEHRAMGHC